MRFLKLFSSMLAAVMFMLSAVSGLCYASDIVIADEEIDPETGLIFTLLDDGTYSVKCPEVNRDKLVGKFVVPSEYKGKAVTEIDAEGFYGCNNITSVEVPKGMIIPWSAFYYCRKLTEINIDPEDENYSSVDGVLFDKNKTDLLAYPAGKPDETYSIPSSVKCLWTNSFACSVVKHIIVEEGVHQVNTAFYDCVNLETIDIPESVEIFRLSVNNTPLKRVNVDENNQRFSSIDGVLFSKDKTELEFYPCGRDEDTYVIPDSVEVLKSSSIYNCNNLRNVIIPNSVNKIEESAIYCCNNLETINIPVSVTDVGDHSNNFLTSSVLGDLCPKLNAITVDSKNENYCSVDGVLFDKDMTHLLAYPSGKKDESYSVPDGVKQVVKIDNVNLRSLYIPDGVEKFYGIGTYEYESNTRFSNLELLTLPSSLKYVRKVSTTQDDAEVRYSGTLNEWKELTDDLDFSTFTILCADGSIKSGSPIRLPISQKNEDGTFNFVPGVTKDVAEYINNLSTYESARIGDIINNISIKAPANAGFDTNISLYVTPNVPVTQDFGSRCFSLDLTFKNSEGDRVQPIKPVIVKVPVPERLKNSSPIYVYHIGDDGKAEKIEAVTETVDNIRYVVFETDSFSTYVLTATEIKNPDDNSGSTSGDTSGSTSDDTSVPTSSDTSDPSSGDTSGTDKPSVPDKPVSVSGKVSKYVLLGENTPKTEIKTPNGTLIEAVLTADEQEQLKNGVDIDVVLKVNQSDSTVSDTDKAIVEEEIRKAGYKSGLYLDLKLFKTIGGEEIQIDKTNAPITVSFEIPESLRGVNRKYAVVRVYNGKADVLNDYSGDKNTVMIRTDKFSTYVLAYSEKSGGTSIIQPDNNSGSVPGSTGDNPNTSGNSHTKFYFIAGIISLFVFVILCLFTGKNGMTEEEKERKFAKLIAWGKNGGKIRAAVALAAIFLLVSFYYGIGMKTSEN